MILSTFVHVNKSQKIIFKQITRCPNSQICDYSCVGACNSTQYRVVGARKGEGNFLALHFIIYATPHDWNPFLLFESTIHMITCTCVISFEGVADIPINVGTC